MINTISDLLEQFKLYALTKIEQDESNVKHRVTIGEMFEGVTQQLLSRSVFKGLNLKIVQRSFISNDEGAMSDEMDCMLVVGEGQNISFSGRFKYHIRDVIAVFQVKKNLYANDIDDSHQNLRSVLNISTPRDAEPFVGRMHRDAYRALVGKELPERSRVENLPDKEKMAYHLLLMEAFHPLRIVIGYYGYSSEYSLREGFVKKMEQNLKDGSTKGYSPGGLPNLYICGNNTIIKNDGMPMAFPFTQNPYYWEILMSSSEKSMYHMLELIWTRLSYKFGISSDIFGDDFDYEAAHPFLACKVMKLTDSHWGWDFRYHYLTRKQLSLPMSALPWKPYELDVPQVVILQFFQAQGYCNVSDPSLLDLISRNNIDFESTLQILIKQRLLYQEENEIGLLVDDLQICIAGDGKIYAGENKSGEMSHYLLNLIKKSG
ncbi:hypothetical protein L0663_08820 [Dyadobacter sp. CY107]|uniref:DUF6602 domain-containing protein n=1 Tax=Dyadobacter fanqingshengii TaxID=2906443 RepID=UPI001F47CC18|nr:DUF6602 domain-containing protein [Dyadobacter fanqingshengii]MCF2503475.1 hypothetical protein [Dyadobacter fanqingshengii]